MKFEEYIKLSKEKIKVADYMLNMTYKLVKDNKIFISVAENLYLAFDYAISAMLYFEKYKRRKIKLIPINNNFDLKIKAFEDFCLKKYNFDREFIDLGKKLKRLMEKHKTSPIEFSRKEKYVILDKNNNMIIITYERLKLITEKVKNLVKEIYMIIISDGKISYD